jgi:N-acyl amino acid synthase of PEP-CTERM/exosortase system
MIAEALLTRPDTESLPQLFARSFAVARANTPSLEDAFYRLRYQVYCIENQFEDPNDFPDGRETDAYDEHSLHAALIHRPSSALIGGVRLISPCFDESRELPIHTLVEPAEDRIIRAYPARHTAEISRYTVSRQFRRRAGEAQYPDTNSNDWADAAEYRRILPNITLGLMRAVLGFCGEHDIRYLFATMAPPLLRLLDRFGLHFEPLGKCVNFHGVRQPCIAKYSELLNGLRRTRADFYDVVRAGFDAPWEVQVLSDTPEPRRKPEAAQSGPLKTSVTVVVGAQRYHTAAILDRLFSPGEPEATGELDAADLGALGQALQEPSPRKSIWFGDAHEYDLKLLRQGPRFRATLRGRAAN